MSARPRRHRERPRAPLAGPPVELVIEAVGGEGDLIVIEGIIKLREGIKVRYESEGGNAEVSQRIDVPNKVALPNGG